MTHRPRRDEAMIRYYAERAPEYDRIYEKPERQDDLDTLRRIVRSWAAGRDVLEIACGTGYWTQELARTAHSVTATDAAPEVLERARARDYGCPVAFTVGDALDPYDPSHEIGAPTMLFAGFLLSHLPREGIAAFLRAWAARMGPGAAICLLDNRYVEDSSRPIARTDDFGNSYQKRVLDSGAEYEVLKNFYGRGELERFAGPWTESFELTELTYYWACRFVVGGGSLPEAP